MDNPRNQEIFKKLLKMISAPRVLEAEARRSRRGARGPARGGGRGRGQGRGPGRPRPHPPAGQGDKYTIKYISLIID